LREYRGVKGLIWLIFSDYLGYINLTLIVVLGREKGWGRGKKERRE
jgi:hypothetical protein